MTEVLLLCHELKIGWRIVEFGNRRAVATAASAAACGCVRRERSVSEDEVKEKKGKGNCGGWREMVSGKLKK